MCAQVNFFQWKSENNVREIKILRRYHVQDRDDYMKYNKVAGLITKLSAMLKDLPHDVSFYKKKVDTSKIHAQKCQSIQICSVCRQSDAMYNTLLLQSEFLRITELTQHVHFFPNDCKSGKAVLCPLIFSEILQKS